MDKISGGSPFDSDQIKFLILNIEKERNDSNNKKKRVSFLWVSEVYNAYILLKLTKETKANQSSQALLF